MRFLYTFLLCTLFSFLSSRAEERNDTVISQSLEELVVTAKPTPNEIIPAQILSGEELKKLSSNSVADALRYFAGIQVKDYGGVGGLKTVNVRSMGTHHVGVAYDGVQLGNAQNGQIDLGQFSLDNIESISLYNGQKSAILQPARDFGSAATVYLKTREPKFSGNKKVNVRFTYRGGSFDLINPSAVLDFKLSKRVNLSVSGEWLKSSGRYKFRYKRVNATGEVAYDTTAIRQNGDINAGRAEVSINGFLNTGEWHGKGYFYYGDRGIPGAIVNNVWRRGERVTDCNYFFQGRYSGYFGKFSTLNNMKFAHYFTHYVNNDDRQLKIDNRYRQFEFYLSTANQYEIFPWWLTSLSYDFMLNRMTADLYDFVSPTRYSNYLSAATSFDFNRFKAQASLLTTFIADRFANGENASSKSVVTPAVYISGNPLNNTDFSLRAFFKKSFRMPTFNDLYYADMGNSRLEPERVTQYNLGAVYSHVANGIINAANVSVDGYFNNVKNKIVAYPKGQQFRWTMLNLGKVHINGVDISALLTLNPLKDLFLTLRGQYTFQKAIDVTSPSDSYYRNQIPYVPRHSGSAIVNLSWTSWNLNYSFIYVGERYNQQENIIYNYTQPWYTSDLSLSKDFQFGKLGMRVLLEINNLFSQDYDVIINYPMPKRNYRVTLTFTI